MTDLFAQEVIKLNTAPKELDVSTAISVEIISSNKNEMHVTCDSKESLERFRHKEINGKLELLRKSRGGIFNITKGDSERIYIKLYTTNINKLELVDVSGASSVYSDEVLKNKKMILDLSGASKIDFDGEFDSLVTEVSGASKLIIKGNAVKLRTETSGASSFIYEGDFTTLEADVSGASKLTIEGRGDTANLDVSGASSFNGERCYVAKAKIDASGASKARVHAKLADNESSGMSRVKILDYND